MSGFLAVKSLVSPCIRIMSPLLTVAIVSDVSAIEGAETKSAAAPIRTPRTFLTVTSLCVVLSIYSHVELMFTPGIMLVKAVARDFDLAQRLHLNAFLAWERRPAAT